MIEPLPTGTTVDDVVAAVQAAWTAGDYTLACELTLRYLGGTYCMRCGSLTDLAALWHIRDFHGTTVIVCAGCEQIAQTEPIVDRREVLIVGPPVKITQTQAFKTTRVEIVRVETANVDPED